MFNKLELLSLSSSLLGLENISTSLCKHCVVIERSRHSLETTEPSAHLLSVRWKVVLRISLLEPQFCSDWSYSNRFLIMANEITMLRLFFHFLDLFILILSLLLYFIFPICWKLLRIFIILLCLSLHLPLARSKINFFQCGFQDK